MHRPLQRPANQERADNAKKHSRGASDQAEHYRFPQELQLNRFFRGAHSNAHANLSSPLRYRNEHDVHDSNSTDDERNRSDSDQENGEGLTGFQLRLNDVFRIPDIEIIFLFRTQVMAVAQQRCCFLAGDLHRVLRNRRTQNVVQPRDSLDFFLRGRVRKNDGVVLVLPGNGKPLGQKSADNFARQILYADHFSNRIFHAKKLIAHGAPDDANVRGAICVVL